MRHRASVFACLIMAGCAVGAPPGFSSGDRWTFPLVGPLEDGVLVTPATVHGHGPYLFAIDPDANVTAIDKQLVEEAGLRMGLGPHRIDETDTGQVRFYAEMLDLQIANLTVDRRDAMVFPVGFYDTEGRHLRGVIGRDVIADSLVFGFDRDQGIATLSTVKAFKPPPDALAIKYESVSSESSAFVTNVDRQQAAGQGAGQTGVPASSVGPVPRRLAVAQIGGGKFGMHLDLGAATSQLAESRWTKAKLTPADVKLRLVDEAASEREVSAAGIASEVTLAGTKTFQVTFVPYIEKRFRDNVDGALGLDFFRPYAVYASWDARTYFLKLRGDLAATAAARNGRWGAAIPACPHPGCITTELTAGAGGVMLGIARDPAAAGRALEVFLGVTPAPGKSVTPLVVELPAGADKLAAALPAGFAGAAFTVLDVSPFPRSCPTPAGCVLQVGAPWLRPESAPQDAAPAQGTASDRGSPEPGDRAAGSSPPPPKNMPLDKLHRLSGEPVIPPSDDVKRAAAGKPIAAAILRVCLGSDGKVESTKITKSSGIPIYDEQLQATIKATWTFSPGDAVCTTATFVAR